MLLISAIVIVEVWVRVCLPSINSDRDHEPTPRRRCPPSGHAQEVLRTEPALVLQELDCTDPGEHECQLSHTVTEYPPCDTHGHVYANGNGTDTTEQGMGFPICRFRPIASASSGPRAVRKCRRLHPRLSPKTDRHHDIPTERP